MALLFLLALAVPVVASAQTFPALTGRVVDNADLLPPADEAALAGKLEALEENSGRQFVVATVPDLQGRTIEDYGYRLGRTWGIGRKGEDDGTILLVAVKERKIRIETGYGIRPVLTDAVSSVIIRNSITPAFKKGDFARGIQAGADQIITMLQLPQAEGEARARAIGEQEQANRREDGGSIFPLIFWGAVLLFIVIPMIGSRAGRGRRYRRGGAPIILWGPGTGGSWGSGGSGGGFGGGWGGGGGFSGGGGSFGGGGASGGW
ncbi:TPM domain-containing protein [Sphingosinicella rhizophila]|uniref:TPM domain-containing protein n=1 Tax=Sphingosinicella rhizophila TaxID=3050082 RepID=A0ABU3QC54_9SPHN|nr:TPM domain-containing protein [Sphingosinicella sp. GR2756]MDT9600982.1 TPM domain-containing protein [Sphingosinicella sp. GR2756]